MDIIGWIVENWMAVVGALVGLLGAVLMILKLIPGEQGEAWIEKVMEWLKKLTGNNVSKK